MQIADFPAFEQAFNRLCAAFDTPPTQARKDAYWQAFRKVTPAEFLRGVDAVLTESDTESMPSVTALREMMRRRHIVRQSSGGADVQAQLCEHVMRHYGRRLSAQQVRGPWTYIGTNGEITAVLIHPDGHYPGFRVTREDLQAPDVSDAPTAEADA